MPFDLETVMRTSYEIDRFQRAYFVLPSFDVLHDAFQTADLAAIVGRDKAQPALDPARLSALADLGGLSLQSGQLVALQV